MDARPSLFARFDTLAPKLTRDELGIIADIAVQFISDRDAPAEAERCLDEYLDEFERRIIDDALHGRGLAG